MALICWLPLLGTTENQGCGSITATNNGAVIDNNGKIGKCYSFNGNDYYIALTGQKLFDCFKGGTTAFSICMWVYHTDTRRAILFGDYGLSNSIGFNIELNTGHSLRFYWNGSPDYSPGLNVGLNTWSHIALTYDGTSLKSYLNGNLVATRSGALATRSKTAGEFRLGRDNRTTDTALNGKLNDIRVYGDHCLSAAEVKEIAQGLVLHYKLDASSEEKITIIPSTNAYSYPIFNTSTASGGWNHWGPSGHSGSYGQNTDKKYIYNKNNTYSHWITEDTGTGKYYLLYQSPTFEGGYRSLQAIIKEENGLQITESICYPSWNARNGGVPNYKWTTIKSLGDGFYYCCCEGVSQDGSNDLIGIIVQPGYKIYVSECYLENNTETCSPIFTYSSNIVQDSSGYNHNGSILNDVLISSDTPRYSTSTNLVAGNSAINCGRGGMVTDSITVNLWLKSSTWANPVSCTESGGWNFESSGDYFRFPVYISDVGYKYGVSATKRTELCNNQWHMLTGVYDRINGHIKIYVDGELDNDYNAGTTNAIGYHGSNVIWLGAEASGSSTAIGSNGMAGLFSDFRIYCTPLLDTDIKQLYNVSMKIDKTQNIHNFELVEKGYNILAATPWCNNYSTHNPITSPFTNFNANGEVQFTTNGSSAGTNYLEIASGVYEYDYTISVNAGNQFYIGFERYDADKTSRSNNACTYTYATKPSTDVMKQRYKGTVDLSTDGTNPLKYIALRILNGWSGTTSGVTGQATIHNFSLRLQSAAINPKITKAGQLIGDEFKEYSNVKFYKDHIIEANQFIER